MSINSYCVCYVFFTLCLLSFALFLSARLRFAAVTVDLKRRSHEAKSSKQKKTKKKQNILNQIRRIKIYEKKNEENAWIIE